MCSLLAGNNFQKCTTFSTSVSELAASVSDELDIASRNHDNDRLISMYDNFACEYDKQLVTEEKDIEFVRNHLPIEKGVLKDIEKGPNYSQKVSRGLQKDEKESQHQTLD